MDMVLNITNNGTFGPSEDYIRPVVLTVLELTSLFIIMICAFIGNVTAISIILRVASLRKNPHNLLIMTLALGDLGVVFTSMPFSAVSTLDGGEFLRTHAGACKFSGFCVILFSLATFMTTVAIAIDRVFIVTSSKNGHLRVAIMIVFLWSFSFACGLLPVTEIVSTTVYVHYTRHCTYKDDEEEDERFRIIMRTVIIGIVLPSLTVCYSIIAFFLWRQKRKLRALQRPGRSLPEQKIKAGGGKVAYSTTTTDTTQPSSGGISVADTSTSITVSQAVPGIPDAANTSTAERIGNTASPNWKNDRGVEDLIKETQNLSSTDTAPKVEDVRRIEENNVGCSVNIIKRDKKRLELQKRVALIGFLLVLSQIVCWGPFFLVRAMSVDVPESVGVFTMWSAYCVNVINPLIYAFMNQRARKELILYKNTIKQKLCCE